jgi:predicted O-linked N-acetylglucosamine transferase (SPINDLY family)
MSDTEGFASAVLKAWQGELDFTALIDCATSLEAGGHPQLAAVLYQTWLSKTPSVYAHAAHFNLGVTLGNLGDWVGAEAAYQRAIGLSPAFIHPHLNLGLLLERQGQMDAAIQKWQWIERNVARNDPNRPVLILALNHLGRVLEGLKRFKEALAYLTESLMLEPNQPDALHHWIFLRQKICAWPVYEALPGLTRDAVLDAASALAMLSLSDDPGRQLRAARQYVEKKLAKQLLTLSSGVAYGHRKIRIGYCSSDFCLHPVSLLTVQMFELHDRESFEVFGFCWSPEDGSATRQRVMTAMDHFVRIQDLDDGAAARLIRSHEIDILVDLQGQTSGARANMLGYRPAPIQVTYLGLPATTGLPSIDYVIADEFLIPREQASFYSETPIYMPHVYQVSDRLRPQGEKPTRASCDLPDDAFVFCSFNNSFKYTPDVFETWLRILQGVPGSVLWLLADNPWAEENLRREAERRGVARDRLVFATRVSPENYLARYLIVDLFLDTFPFNAGTTANDCLWMGCPLLTLTGSSFASRMAGALLTAAGLPELITTTLADYESLAVALAHDPVACRQMRLKLQRVRADGTLFDTPQFVRDLEQRFKGLVAELPLPLSLAEGAVP